MLRAFVAAPMYYKEKLTGRSGLSIQTPHRDRAKRNWQRPSLWDRVAMRAVLGRCQEHHE